MPCLFWVWVEILLLRAFFREISRLHIVLIIARKNEKFSSLQIKIIIYVKIISKLYTIILINYEICPFIFWDLYNRWVLASQQKALGPCKCTRFRVMQTYRNYSFSYFDALFPQKRLILSLLMRTISSPEIFTKKMPATTEFRLRSKRGVAL